MSYAGSLEEMLEARAFDYPVIIRSLADKALKSALSSTEQALLGISYFRMARLAEAEIQLRQAIDTLPSSSARTEALLELAAIELTALQPDRAEAWLNQITPTTSPWLSNMLLRRRATLSIARGDILKACTLYEQAWQGFLAADLSRGNILTGFYLGATLAFQGEFERAERYLNYTIAAARVVCQPALLFDALGKKAMLLILKNNLSAAHSAVEEMQSLRVPSYPFLPPYMNAVVLMNEIVLARAKDQHARFIVKLTQLGGLVNERPHPEMIYWLGPIILDSLSKLGRHDQASHLLAHSLPSDVLPPVNVRLVQAIILVRTGDPSHAATLLADLVGEASDAGLRLDVVRGQLHLANALFKSKQHLKVAAPLIAGLRGVALLGMNFLFRDDLASLKSVMKWARHQDEIRLYIDSLSSESVEANHLVLQSFGGFKALLNGQPLSFRLNQQDLLLLLIYIYKHPHCTYAELASEVLTEKSPQTGASYARQAIMLLRQQLGEEHLITLRATSNSPARLRIEKLKVTFDIDALFEAIEQRDAKRVVAIYQGTLALHSTSRYAETLTRLVDMGVMTVLRTQLTPGSTVAQLVALGKYTRHLSLLMRRTAEMEELQVAIGAQLQALGAPAGE